MREGRRFYVTTGCPSVCMSHLAPHRRLAAGLLLWAPRKAFRLLHGASAAGAAAFRFVSTAARRSAANASIVMLSPYSQLRRRQRRLCGLQSNCDDLVTTVQRAATATKPVNHPVTSYFCHIFIFLASS